MAQVLALSLAGRRFLLATPPTRLTRHILVHGLHCDTREHRLILDVGLERMMWHRVEPTIHLRAEVLILDTFEIPDHDKRVTLFASSTMAREILWRRSFT